MVLVQGLHLSPLVLLLMAAAFSSMDPALEEAATASGARPAAVIRRVTLPLAAPALYGCVLLAMVGGLEAFEVPVLLGIPGGNWVLSSRIWSAFAQTPSDMGQAGAYSCSLLLLTAIGVFAYWRVTSRGRRFETLAGGRARPHRFALSRWRRPAAGLALASVGVASVVPLLMLVYCSLQPVYTRPSLDGLSTLTLSHYGDALAGGSLRAFENSLLLGAGTATAVMLAMSVVAWIVVRTRLPGRWLLDVVASLPLVVPGLVLAIALLFLYLRVPGGVYGTLWLLLIAYVTRFMPHGVRFASAAMRQLSGELEDAARVSGAGWGQTFRRVVLPLLVPGLAAGWILVFILSMRELASSILLYSPGTEVVSVRIWQEFQDGRFAGPAALGVVLLGVLGLLAAASWLVGARLDPRRAAAG
jgi:iron(III) transport system permease protein